MTGKFFALEGLECSGKTTLFENLKEKMGEKKTEFIEEAAGYFSKLSPELYDDKEAMEIAYMTNNRVIIDNVSQIIKKDVNAIMDRTWICQIVYSRARKILNPNYNFNTSLIEKQEKLLRQKYPEVYENTIAVFLITDIEILLKRGSEMPNHHRNKEFGEEWLEKTQNLYEERLKEIKTCGGKVEYIKADLSETEVTNQFIEIFQKYT